MSAWFMLWSALAAATPTATSTAPWARGLSDGADLDVEVVTFGAGDDVAEWFGHAALVVRDRRFQVERLYNYGEYEFDAALALRYLQGHLTFHVAERPVDRTIALYVRKNRDVRGQTLALSSSQKVELARALADNVRPENRSYLYDHYTDNCTTRLRDVINQVTRGALKAQGSQPSVSLREHTRRLTAVNAVVGVLIDAVLNDEVDHPLTAWDATFLPAEFEAWLETVTVDGDDGVGHPLVASRRIIHAAGRAAAPAPMSLTAAVTLGVLAGAAIVAVGCWRRRLIGLLAVLVGLVIGGPGTVLFVMATLTDHHVTWGNENLVFANPLTLMLVPGGAWWLASWRPTTAAASTTAMGPSLRAHRALRVVGLLVAALAVIAVVIKVHPLADQQNWRVLALCVPSLVALGTLVRSVRPAAG